MKEAIYECSRCLGVNTSESDEIASGKCIHCDEIDYWDFKVYTNL